MIHVAALYDHLANGVSCRMSEQTRNRRSCVEQRRHATRWWRKKKSDWDFSFLSVWLAWPSPCDYCLVVPRSFISVLLSSSGDAKGSWPAGGPLCACFRDSACWWVTTKKRWPLHSFIMGRSAKVRVDKLHYESLWGSTKKSSVSHNFLTPEREGQK